MNPAALRALRHLARSHGVQLSYVSAAGESKEASPEALKGVLGALGCPIDSTREIPERLQELKAAKERETLPPVVIAWDAKKTSVTVPLPAKQAGKPRFRLTLEDGSSVSLKTRRATLKPTRGGMGNGLVVSVDLPSLPYGYHQLELDPATSDRGAESLVISAPGRSYAPREGAKRLGLFLPLYAAHSRTSWGAGNISDWERLGRWAADHGVGVMAALPILATFLGRPLHEPSPYSPASRLFWSEFYIDIERAPEFAASRKARRRFDSAAFQARLRSFRRQNQIDYSEEMMTRREILEILAAEFFSGRSPRRPEFEEYASRRRDLRDYAAFRAACDAAESSWHTWPARARDGELRPADYKRAVQQYYAYTQWVVQEQMTGLVERSCERGLSLYLDLPLGVHPDSYDVWRRRELFALRASAGAPPDPFFSKGQDWGFAPLHPLTNRRQRYQYVLEYLRFQMRHTGMLRIDHVMGLHRLYWVPHGLPPTDGAYVTYPADELYGMLSLESHRHKTVLVGENLGTVPPAVNASMRRHGLRRMFVVQFEQRPDPQAALPIPPKDSVASLNTHDMPTFAAHCSGADIQDRHDLGLLNTNELRAERKQREIFKRALVGFFHANRLLPKRQVHGKKVLRACLEWLARSRAEVVLVNLEDLWLETRPQNVPGTSRERPNWRRKARLSVDSIEHNSELAALLQRLATVRKTNS